MARKRQQSPSPIAMRYWVDDLHSQEVFEGGHTFQHDDNLENILQFTQKAENSVTCLYVCISSRIVHTSGWSYYCNPQTDTFCLISKWRHEKIHQFKTNICNDHTYILVLTIFLTILVSTRISISICIHLNISSS